MVQLIKVALFATMLAFDYSAFQNEVMLIIGTIVLGTLVSKKILKYISEKHFVLILQIILCALGGKLIFSSLFS